MLLIKGRNLDSISSAALLGKLSSAKITPISPDLAVVDQKIPSDNEVTIQKKKRKQKKE